MNQMGGQANLMNQTANQVGGVSDALMMAGQNFLDQGQSFADGSNPFYARMRQNMLGDLSAQATMGARQGMEALAGMGAGSKGMRDIIAGKSNNTAMQQLGGGYESMLNQGMGLATTYGGMGMQGMQNAGSLLNMAGGLQQGAGGLFGQAGNLGMAGASLGQANNQFNASQANQMALANMNAQNQATQFGLEGNYQSAFNRQGRTDDMLNNVLSAGATIAPYLMFSDKRIKHDIKQVGYQGRYPVYTYKYNHAPNTEFTGVMAQDVEKINPKAVIEIDGIKRVNYLMLGE